MTIKNALKYGVERLSRSKTPALDAEVLLGHILNKDKSWIYLHQSDILTSDWTRKYQKLISRRKKGEPVAYITNHKEFYGLDFYVDEFVLIPRPETELLVEEALAYCSSKATYNFVEMLRGKARTKKLHSSRPAASSSNSKYKILDIGTGSGNIIISIARSLADCHSRPDRESIYSIDPRFRHVTFRGIVRGFRGDDTIEYYAMDISNKALKIAQKNAKQHKVKIHFIKSDLFQSIPKIKFDIIIANLPYLWKNFPDYEPGIALNGGQDGLEIIKKFLFQVKNYLSRDTAIIFEIDPRQSKLIKKITKNFYPDKEILIKKDLAMLDRIVILR